MLMVNLRALMEKKSALENRRISYLTIEKEIGIKQVTLSRMSTNYNYNFSRGDLEKLLIYFNCQPNDLLTLIRDEERSSQQEQGLT